MFKDAVVSRQLFSARQILLHCDDPYTNCLQRCVLEAKTFLDSSSVSSVLASLFLDQANIRSVLESVQGIFHVGFMVESRPETIGLLKQFSNEAGLSSGHIVFESTIISRELGELSQGTDPPTTIFKAFESEFGPSNYIEVLISDQPAVTDWIEHEVGTHIGFTLSDPSSYLKVRDAFLAEGFDIPKFMSGKPMTNPTVGASAVYFDKIHCGRTVRVEICNCVSCV